MERTYQQLARAIENKNAAERMLERDVHPDTARRILERAKEVIEAIMGTAPHGSGFDGEEPIALDEERSTGSKLRFYVEYHAMSEGYYVGWLQYGVEITAETTLYGDFDLDAWDEMQPETIATYEDADVDVDGIREYVVDVMNDWLRKPWKWPTPAESTASAS